MRNSLARTMAAAILTLVATTITAADTITLSTLLSEMVSAEESAKLPEVPYRCLQESSHDRRSVSPGAPGWFANEDGYGIIRTDTVQGRREQVLLDCHTPGAITRFWLTTLRKDGTLRFYFDGATEASLTLPAYDLSLMPVPGIIGSLVLQHTSYTPTGKGGETMFLPLPFAKGCKVTWEDAPGVAPSPKYYQINYREYAPGTAVETFTLAGAREASAQIKATASALRNPTVQRKDCKSHRVSWAGSPRSELKLTLPKGEQAVYELRLRLSNAPTDTMAYAEAMRHIIVRATFDGEQTIWCPLSDFSAGGLGAPEVRSFFTASDGHGLVTSRWLMPYRKSGEITLENISDTPVALEIEAETAPLAWTPRSLHFHTSWRAQSALPLTSDPDDWRHCSEWRFATLQGKGIYKGDVLTVYNDSRAWYGEGDEKIWVDGDTFPSHFGTGTEDYYNSSWAPVYVFHTPFGGAPRADQGSSHGYNTFFRTRCLDGIPFDRSLRFDLELLSWVAGEADFASTVFWYGAPAATAPDASGVDEARKPLHPIPADRSQWHREGSIEFETLTPTARSSQRFGIETQNMLGFVDGEWSGATQLVLTGCQEGDSATFTLTGLADRDYTLLLYMTRAADYGRTAFTVNGQRLAEVFDGYDTRVTCVPVSLGRFRPDHGTLTLTVTQSGKNAASRGLLLGLDCAVLK